MDLEVLGSTLQGEVRGLGVLQELGQVLTQDVGSAFTLRNPPKENTLSNKHVLHMVLLDVAIHVLNDV